MAQWIPLIIALVACVVILAIVYIMLEKQQKMMQELFKRDVRNLNIELSKERLKFFLPQRVDAYQRFVLLMDRITPGNIVLRFHNPEDPAKKVQLEILQAIRDEFNHNVAQQLFVTKEAWKMICDAKEESIRIINLAGDSLDASAMSLDLATRIMEITAEVGKMPTQIASDFLKDELQQLF